MSPPAAEFPPTDCMWKVRNRSSWVSELIQAKGKEEDKDDGMKRGDFVRIRHGCHCELFHEGERGVVVGKLGSSHRIQFEGRHATVTVASWRLSHLPEGMGVDGQNIKKELSFSLPPRHIEDIA